MGKRFTGWATGLMLVAALGSAGSAAAQTAPATTTEADDVVVVAVVDGSFNPYHWDFKGSRMPQHLDSDPSNNLPLGDGPAEWLPGFDASKFASYNELDITDGTNANAAVAQLQAADAAKWSAMKVSTSSATNYYYIPDTKVIGAVRFGTGAFQAPNASHGNGTSSVAVGNIHGSCPTCVVVMVTYGGNDREAASNWAMSQPWIDVVTNSFGFSQVERERLYSDSDTELQKTATERGQNILFSSGNGISNTFTVPNPTLFSSQEGPDWIITVGGVTPSGGNYTGAGKPADIASVGGGYKSAYGGTTVTGEGDFGGTSNATPVAAGMLATSLYEARKAMEGPSRAQDGGVVARGAFTCGAVRPNCELGDGVLTTTELRTRFFEAAARTPQGFDPGGTVATPAKTEETELAAEGYGAFFGRVRNTTEWRAEQARISGPMFGTAAAQARPAGEREWFVVDSWCRQQIWGTWGGGSWTTGQALPGADPAWPVRTLMSRSCDQLFPPVAPAPAGL